MGTGVCLHVCWYNIACLVPAEAERERALDSLELESQTCVNCHTEDQTWVFGRATSVLNCSVMSPTPKAVFLNYVSVGWSKIISGEWQIVGMFKKILSKIFKIVGTFFFIKHSSQKVSNL